MNFIDIFIAAAFLIFGWIGFRRGILRTVLSIIGLVVGGAAGAIATPSIQSLVSNSAFGFKPTIGLTSIILGSSLGMFLFGVLGSFLRVVLLPLPFMKTIDSLIGFGLAIIAVASISSTLSSAAEVIPNKTVNNLFSQSQLISQIDLYLPERFKDAAQKIQNVITDSPLPEVFKSLVESRITPTQLESDVAIPAIVTKSVASTVRIDGIAESCSAAMVGTGFIVSPERVITNAHVVAGVKEPVITLFNSQTQLGGRVIAIDRKKDIAIIFVPGLTGEKLTFIGPVTPNEIGFVVGYPNGGNLRTMPVSVTSEFESIGTDIDGNGETRRDVIVFGGDVKPGNSGGPLLNDQGQVLGVVFAADAENKNTGYALAPSEVAKLVSETSSVMQAIETGQCAKAS
jgi:S1-C subfamily serine protease